ncbi:MAG: RnfABCDGE type electron transport complex subunit G [Cyclobacteriaceae bacterium]|nr:RnfABCDGE type electron transport complex subunit G [Cyclobacteriaceae bacterium]
MAKKESTLFNMVFSLVVVAILSSSVLGYVYEVTKEPIAEAQKQKKIKAIKEVVAEFDNNPVEEMYKIPAANSTDSLEDYPAKKGSEIVGSAIRTNSPNGYSGNIWLMVGFLPDGTINKITVLEHKETPGLGSKMGEDKFKSQFYGKNPSAFNLKVKKDGGEIDALSGATITSRAFGQAVQQAYDSYMKGGKHD